MYSWHLEFNQIIIECNVIWTKTNKLYKKYKQNKLQLIKNDINIKVENFFYGTAIHKKRPRLHISHMQVLRIKQ